MSIHLPNLFSCVSRTLVLDDGEPLDLRPLAQPGVPEELLEQLVTSRVLVTLSSVVSTSKGERDFTFEETLLKVPVSLRGERYLFPVVGYVTHEYSLVRGYLLGFNKVMVGSPATTFTLDAHGHRLDASGAVVEAAAADDLLPDEHGDPLLLWRDYGVGPARASGLATLVVSGYQRDAVRPLAEPVSVQRLLGRDVKSVGGYEIRDRFVVDDVRPLAS